ncbi:hypothetical protein Micbo1qcDRAFT_158483 [Microdochium bolleyi]|uniref:Uncharacterized protein n=1 Tax=Microdochium bolleyi TaxID=196109 RepID=A0A136JGH7_9PEZI|nr:hypothetical protein Micbo1qcDRAFT_158483 [Microdochium bolleyi]
MRYRDDNMLLRRQQTVASVDKSAHALFLFRTQLLHASRPENSVLLKGIPRLRRPCNHMSWLQVDTWREAVDGLLESLCPNNHDTEHKEHSPSCFSHDRRDLALEPGNMIFGGGIAAAAAAAGRPSTRVLGGGDDDVRGCDRCTTDAHLAVIPLPEPYRWGFALTTWLDVGKIDLSKKWDSHRPDTGQNRDYPRHAEPKGSIARAFECLGPGERFEPKLSELNQARLTNFGSVSAAPGRGSRSGSWTVEHGVDPATGRLLDPDPLTELDY